MALQAWARRSAASLFNAEATLARNAACSDHIHLRDCDPFTRNINFWDEASVHIAPTQRKLSQSPTRWADLGGNPTARTVYRVWFNVFFSRSLLEQAGSALARTGCSRFCVDLGEPSPRVGP